MKSPFAIYKSDVIESGLIHTIETFIMRKTRVSHGGWSMYSGIYLLMRAFYAILGHSHPLRD